MPPSRWRARPLRATPLPALLLALLTASGCDEDGSAGAGVGAGRPGPPVVLGAPELRDFVDSIEALGTARANESVVITARDTETVQRVLFEDGATVKPGDVLVELTSTEESAQLDEVRAQHADAKQRYDRVFDLYEQGTESASRMDEVTAQLNGTRARLASLEARLSDRLIAAPFGGVLGLRDVSPGTLVKPGDRITTLDDIDVVKLDFSVPETFLASLQTGLSIETRSAAYPERIFAGEVVAIDTRLDPATRSATVRAEIDNPDHLLRPGMLLTVILEANPRRSLAVPEEALLAEAQRHFAVRVDAEGKAARVEVSVGRRVPGYVEILSGLAVSDRVVVDGASKVRPGATVRAVATREAGVAAQTDPPQDDTTDAPGA